MWIYIANETSPLTTYSTMIPGIRGLHYRLDETRWRYLCDERFDIDGIPSYVVVEKTGTREDIDTMRAELESKGLLTEFTRSGSVVLHREPVEERLQEKL